MASKIFIGNAQNIAQLDSILLAGTMAIGQVYSITMNGKVVSYTSVSGDTNTTATAALQSLLAASTIPEFQEVSWAIDATTATQIDATAQTAGTPFVQTSAATGTGTLVTTHTTANTGANNWDNAANWAGGVVPVSTDDVYVENSSVSILYGLAQSGVTLTSLNVAQTFTGQIGLPIVNALGYYEYRATYLAISATTLNIGRGPVAAGAALVRINLGSVQSTVNVDGTGQATGTGIPALQLLGTHASNVLNVTKGNLSFAFYATEVSTVATVNIGSLDNPTSDVTLVLGSGCTLTTVNQYGGTVLVQSAVTTFTQINPGVATFQGTGAVTTLTSRGGTVNYESSGTITTLNLVNQNGGATIEFDRNPRGRTVTNTSVYGGCDLEDPWRTVTHTNPVALKGCGLVGTNAATINKGADFNIAFS